MNEHSSAIYACQQQVHYSLGNLIQLCDEALISDNEENFIALNKENVKEYIENLDNAVTVSSTLEKLIQFAYFNFSLQNLVNQANEKTSNSKKVNKNTEIDNEQRSSLPDIPLTKWEKAGLENSSSMFMQNSHSSESILALIPPPKPSKDRVISGPPLPPKHSQNHNKKAFSIEEASDDVDNVRSEFMAGSNISFRGASYEPNETVFESVQQRKFGSFSAIGTSKDSNNMTHAEAFKDVFTSEKQQLLQCKLSPNSRRDCEIQISQETCSRSFHTISTSVSELNNSFSSLNVSQDNSFKVNQNDDTKNFFTFSEEQPPPLPIKTRSRSLRIEHPKSVYDNVDDVNRNSTDTLRNSLETKASTTSSNSSLTSSLSARTDAGATELNIHQLVIKNKYKSCIESSTSFGIGGINDSENPPPLPLKKKHSK